MRTITDTFIRLAPVVALLASVSCGGNRSDVSDAVPLAAATASASAEDNSVYAQQSTWVTQSSDSIRLSTLSGRVQVVAMVYTNCHSTCPLIIADMKRIESALLDADRDNVGFVLISLDPVRDTPERMADWAASVGLDQQHWTLLSGDESAIREMSALLGIRYQVQQNGEYAHSNALTVLDRNGSIAHQQLALGESAASVARVKSLLK